MCGCGLPSVTLLGARGEWEEIEGRLEKLAQYGSEPAQWAELLRPIIKHMLMTFDDLDSELVKQLWLQVAQQEGSEGSGQGIETLSGWIAAFA
ncbi:hypothetical protein HIM_04564 [Hirsutella minnesotensis 3608]|uniref:Uncharacterized protein n=1 Tax=Hirsutella minnesotensis 3608 TaxID=1043627 RepID=A0A0F7ZV72_9HYPO|nr:hypothetical protein HIM_04564 [Hirsutella minnesotensis 3608]